MTDVTRACHAGHPARGKHRLEFKPAAGTPTWDRLTYHFDIDNKSRWNEVV